MASSIAMSRLDTFQNVIRREHGRTQWQRMSVRTRDDMGRAVQILTDAMSESAYPDRDVFGMCLTLERVLEHALCRDRADEDDPALWLGFHVNEDRVLVEVDKPTAREELQRLLEPQVCPSGEVMGEDHLPLLFSALTWIRYGPPHSRFLMLCKRRASL